jgi:hypothetical protein
MVIDQLLRELFTGMNSAELYATQDIFSSARRRYPRRHARSRGAGSA